MNSNPPLNLDGYKVDHKSQYPENSQLVFSNLTARGTRVKNINKVVFFGLQYFIKEYLINDWNENFFNKDIEEVVKKYNRRLNNYLGPNNIGEKHIRDLHELGYLPLEIWALPEGSEVNLRVPLLVVWNTDKRFFWLTNAIETILSNTLWLPCTSATTALMYKELLNKWATKTNPEMVDFVQFQGHDFSMRGHSSLESAKISGAAHLLSFVGTDTIPAIDFLEEYYNADSDKELVGCSVSASEHSCMCLGSSAFLDNKIDENHPYKNYIFPNETENYNLTEEQDLKLGELRLFERLISEVYPNGIVSIVMDTFDFWNAVDPVNGICKTLKDKILSRDGKTVIRPDTGDPVKIVTGYFEDEIVRQDNKIFSIEKINNNEQDAELTELEVKGLIQCLYEIFGGTVTSTGYLQLDSHIGAIYGDSITLKRASEICERLSKKGFASTNVVYGIGSFTYQGAVTDDAIVTRDTYGFAVKSTYGELLINNSVVGREIFKDPKTDKSKLKKSAKGLTAVYKEGNDFILKDQASWDEVKNCAFVKVFENSKIIKEYSLSEIRNTLSNSK